VPNAAIIALSNPFAVTIDPALRFKPARSFASPNEVRPPPTSEQQVSLQVNTS
jgi:hypothetical protein